jgi:hypothetical protein
MPVIVKRRCKAHTVDITGGVFEPWLVRDCITFLEGVVKPQWKVLEYGSGTSTPWFGKHCGFVVSIEHDRLWASRVRDSLMSMGLLNKVDLRLVALAHYASAADNFPPRHFELCVIDGRLRHACFRSAVPKVNQYLVVDNSTRQDAHRICEELSAMKWKQLRFTNNLWATDVWERQ